MHGIRPGELYEEFVRERGRATRSAFLDWAAVRFAACLQQEPVPETLDQVARLWPQLRDLYDRQAEPSSSTLKSVPGVRGHPLSPDPR